MLRSESYAKKKKKNKIEVKRSDCEIEIRRALRALRYLEFYKNDSILSISLSSEFRLSPLIFHRYSTYSIKSRIMNAVYLMRNVCNESYTTNNVNLKQA